MQQQRAAHAMLHQPQQQYALGPATHRRAVWPVRPPHRPCRVFCVATPPAGGAAGRGGVSGTASSPAEQPSQYAPAAANSSTVVADVVEDPAAVTVVGSGADPQEQGAPDTTTVIVSSAVAATISGSSSDDGGQVVTIVSTSTSSSSSSTSTSTIVQVKEGGGGSLNRPSPPSSPSRSSSPSSSSSLPGGLPTPASVDASLSRSLTSFSSVDDDMVPEEAAAAVATARARAALRSGARPPRASSAAWFPPIEFSALIGLCTALALAGASSWALCKPVLLSHCLVHGKHRVMRACGSCCAPPAAQAQHLVFMSRQPARVRQPLPLPLRQWLDVEHLPEPSYKVPSLVSLPGPPDEGLSAALVAAQEWLHSRVAYSLQQLATANVSTKVLALWLLALPFIMMAAAVYQQAAAVSFNEAMYKVYALLMRVPGIGIAKETNAAAYVVANMVFLAGVFSFAAVIGIVGDEIKTGIKESRAGNYPMRLNGHIVLLNWNSGSTALLRHIASAYAEGGMFNNGAPGPWNNRPAVVVLADKPKMEMDHAVHEMLKDRGLKLEVHTREGNPFKMSDLRKVAASKASTIIVLHPEKTSGANAEAIKVSVAMSLTALGAPDKQRVVVQGPSAGTHTVLSSLEATTRQAGGRSTIQAFELPDNQLTHRLVAQTAAQPGILTCWLDLLSLTQSSAEFYCASIPQVLRGKPFVELRRAFLHAVLCGYRVPDGAVVLNPSETDVPPAGSSLILLGRGGAPHLMAAPGDSALYDGAAAAAAERLMKERTYRSKARNILVANWPVSGVPALMEGFSFFTPAGSTITFVLPEEAPPTWPTRLGSCRFNFVTAANPTGVKVLLDAGIKSADAVVLGSGLPTSAELEADAQILSAVLQVQDAVMASKRRDAPHLVAPIRRYATSKLAAQFLDCLAAEQRPVATSTMTPALPWLSYPYPTPTAVLPLPMPAAAPTAAAAAAAAAGSAPAPAAAAAAAPSPAAAAAGGSSSAADTAAGASSSSNAGGGSSSGSSSTPAAGAPRPGLLTSALKAVGALPAAAAAAPAAPQQPQPKPVIVEPEFLVPVDVASALMTQVVSEPAYSDIMRALMLCSDAGSELYLRNPASFNIPTGVPLTFAEVQEAVRLTKQTAIGYIRGQGSSSSSGGGSDGGGLSLKRGARRSEQQRKAVLGCSANHRVTFEEADRIVVIAQDYNM